MKCEWNGAFVSHGGSRVVIREAPGPKNYRPKSRVPWRFNSWPIPILYVYISILLYKNVKYILKKYVFFLYVYIYMYIYIYDYICMCRKMVYHPYLTNQSDPINRDLNSDQIKSMNHWMNEWINQSINHPINHSLNPHSISHAPDPC